MIDRHDTSRCTGCGRCVLVCPLDVFRMEEGIRKAVARYADDCQACYTCEIECPAGAIRIGPFRKNRTQPW